MENKQIAVTVKNVSKRYMIGGTKNTNNTLRDSLAGVAKNLIRRGEVDGEDTREFWALKNVSFEVYKGETLGIIGGNGAGKSTMLKILSRIIDPTNGSFETTGRVASLLEVGTGFHPELTGRENLYFNGSILGMSHKEIESRFQEIVDFAEIGQFIDTPVKFYSSGMSVRLGFAIAAHLDPEILIIDEALAVGDVAFQQKCIEKMRNTARSGKTVLFVSHSMNIIEDLCDRVMYLKNGQVQEIGNPGKVMDTYLGAMRKKVGSAWKKPNDYVDKPENPVTPLAMSLLDENKKPISNYVPRGKPVIVDMKISVKELTKGLSVGVSLFDGRGLHMYRTAVTDLPVGEGGVALAVGRNHIQVALPTDDLLDGSFVVALDCDVYKKEWVHNPYFSEMRASFTVKEVKTALSRPWDPEREGAYKPTIPWNRLP